MFTLLTDLERDTLTQPADHWLRKLDDENRDALVFEIVDAFRSWQERQADQSGQVRVETGGGLLFPLKVEVVSIAQAEPWQCAGPLVRNDIDLAFKLWLDDAVEFAEVIARRDIGTVFALIGAWSTRTAAHGSLIRLNGFLVTLIQGELEIAHRVGKEMFDELRDTAKRKKESIRAVQKLRAQQLREQAQREHANIRQMAREFAENNPRPSRSEVVSHLVRSGVKQKPSTLGRIIAGIVEEARKTPHPKRDLYATRVTRNG